LDFYWHFLPCFDSCFAIKCWVNPSSCKKDAGHFEQKWGFSFVCEIMWKLRSNTLLKAFSQNTQTNGLACKWIFEWRVTSYWDLKRNWQILHLNGLSPVRTLKWRSSFEDVWNIFWHTEQVHCFVIFKFAFILREVCFADQAQLL